MKHQRITAAQTADPYLSLVTPFVNARLNRQRNEQGFMIPRTHGVSITVLGCTWHDADVRGADADGVSLCRMGGILTHVPWSEVKHVWVEELDA